MKKLLFFFVLFPSLSFADRLGALKSSSDVLLTTQAVSGSPGGSEGEVQYNSSGTAFGGTPVMTISGSTASFNQVVTTTFEDMESMMFQDMSTMTFSSDTNLIMSSASTLTIPNSDTLPLGDCNSDLERGRVYVDTNSASGQQFYVCEGVSGWIQQSVSTLTFISYSSAVVSYLGRSSSTLTELTRSSAAVAYLARSSFTASSIVKNCATGASLPSTTPDYVGQWALCDDGYLTQATSLTVGGWRSVPNGIIVVPGSMYAGSLQLQTGIGTGLLDVQGNTALAGTLNVSSNVALNSHINQLSGGSEPNKFYINSTAPYIDNVMYLRNQSGGYSAIAYLSTTNVETGAMGYADLTTANELKGKVYFEAGDQEATSSGTVRGMRWRQYAIFNQLWSYPRIDLSTNGAVDIWQLVPGLSSDVSGNPTSPVALHINPVGGWVGVLKGTPTVALDIDGAGKFSSSVTVISNLLVQSSTPSYFAGPVLATGTFGSGWIEPNLGAGTRLLWYPRKAAFRAGNVSASFWNNAQIGDYSAAFGQNTVASGSNSFASGSGAASGPYSTAMGFASASADSSVGIGGTVSAGGVGCTAMGESATCAGQGASAFGTSSADGDYSFSSGEGSSSAGYGAISMGNSAQSDGDGSISMGQSVNSAVANAITMGKDLVNADSNSFKVGFSATPAFSVFVTSASATRITVASFTVTSSMTTQGNVNISSGILLSNSWGTSGQVLTTNGTNTLPTWTTASGSGSQMYPSTGTNMSIPNGFTAGSSTFTSVLFSSGNVSNVKFYVASSTISYTDEVVLASAPVAGLTLTLPSAATYKGETYHIKKIDQSTGTVTVAIQGAQKIDDQNSFPISIPYQSNTFISDGSQWRVF